jgi:threonine dehydrogenase-like Zn-dependent dehydrogenase
VARVVIVGCGCRGQALARSLRADGHAVRGTTRTEQRRAAIEATGAECWVGTPDRIGTLTYALDGATILCWLLGSAEGSRESLSALHGTRLQMLLERSIDTTVRGVVYEAAGTVEPQVLAGGIAAVQSANRTSEIPYALLEAPPGDHDAWLRAARAAVDGLLET